MARWWTVVVLAAGCSPPEAGGPLTADVARALEAGPASLFLRAVDPSLRAELDALGPASVPADRVEARRRAVGALHERWARELPPGVEIVRRWDHFGVVEVSVPDVDVAQRLGRLGALEVPRTLHPVLVESLDLIDQPTAEDYDYQGVGRTIAILDSGIDDGAPGLGGRVVYEKDFATDDGVADLEGHGTYMAAIAGAVAPEAELLALDVVESGSAAASDVLAALDWIVANQDQYQIAAATISLAEGPYFGGCNDVFEDALAAAADAGVFVAVASGNDGEHGAISSPACNPSAVAVGAVHDDAPGAPVATDWCTDADPQVDDVACFSNADAGLDLLAPGVQVTAGYGTVSGTSAAAAHAAGAATVLMGAAYFLAPAEILDELVSAAVPLTDARSGLEFPRLDLGAAAVALDPCGTTLDPEVVYINVNGSDGSIQVTGRNPYCMPGIGEGSSWLFIEDVGSLAPPFGFEWMADPNPGAARTFEVTVGYDSVLFVQDGLPSATVTLADGAAAVGERTVDVDVAGSLDVNEVCVSNPGPCVWQAYGLPLTATLSAGSGTKTVEVSLRNLSQVEATASDTVLLDETAPVDGALTLSSTDSSATLTWSGFSDAHTSIDHYRAVAAVGATPPASCAGAAFYEGSATTTTVTGLSGGATHSYRVCAVDALGNESAGASATVTLPTDVSGPTGTVAINGGAAYTNSRSVTLSLTASDPAGVSTMCVSKTATCTAFVPFLPAYALSLSGSGTKTAYVKFKDGLGNISGQYTDTIIVDVGKPTNGKVTAVGSSGQIALTWSGFTDSTTSIASYEVHQALNVAPTSCAGTPAWSGAGAGATITGLSDGATYGFRVCAVDQAGNESSGATVIARPAPEYVLPTGSIVIEDGANFTNLKAVDVALTASDASGVTSMCLSTGTSCTAFVPFASTASVTLSGSGTKTVYALFKDAWGNVSAQVNDTIVVDTTKPVTGTLTASPASGEVSLSWTGFSDPGSGIAGYAVHQAVGAVAPATCDGTPVYSGAETTALITGLTDGAATSFRVCATDNAGNVSTGATATTTPAPEFQGPVGTVTVQGGDAYTNQSPVTVALSASDASGVSRMCVSTLSACSTWVPYAASTTVTLSGSGTKTVYATFEDSFGNLSTQVTDTIVYDTTKPTKGTVTATPADAALSLSWTGFTDTNGIASYTLVYDAVEPASCSVGAVGYTGSATSATISGLANGAVTHVRVCATDVAGNVSLGAVASGTPNP